MIDLKHKKISFLTSIFPSNGKYLNNFFESLKNQNFSAYIRLDVKDKHGVLSNITKSFANHKVSIKRLIQNPFKSKKYSSITIITHLAKDINLMKTIKQLANKNYIMFHLVYILITYEISILTSFSIYNINQIN